MKINTVLFDLDGTLLPMNLEIFTRAYLSALAANLARRGYEPKRLSEAILVGTAAMVKNDGRVTNEQLFWNKMTEIYGESILSDMPYFEDFYEKEFDKVSTVCGYDECAALTVREMKNMGLTVALATNPLFPKIATEKRVRWAGLDISDFAFYTTYENSAHCKPNPEYYREIDSKMNIIPEQTLMVGNDTDEDMIAAALGMKVFLLTDNLINRSGKDISTYPHGSFDELVKYVKELV